MSERSIDHVVLERHEVAASWRRQRWDSLRLLTPNHQSRLPGYDYQGPNPDAYMSMPEVIDFISNYADFIEAPVRGNTNVEAVRPSNDGYRIVTDQGEINCRRLVLASGACNRPSIPQISKAVPDSILQLTPFDYRNPEGLPDGGVIVVGASATGAQLAEEIRRSGRPVTICVGEHVRLPRTYRGRDVLWWMEAAGIWNERYDEIDDIDRARGLPSPQLVGTPERATLDLNVLSGAGVEIVGRFASIRDGKVLFSGGLRNQFALADLKMNRLLDTFDEWAAGQAALDIPASERFEPTRAPEKPRLSIDLTSGEFATIIWATGFKPDYSWLELPVLDRKGRLRHDGGVVAAPGLYAIGLPVLRRRKSTFIHGAGDDANDIVAHLARSLD